MEGLTPEQKTELGKKAAQARWGNPDHPDPDHISTSFSERLNLTLRTHNKRFVRLTCAFSKKLENHIASTHLHNFFYNFARLHRTLRVTPAMASGLTDLVWDMGDVVNLLEAQEAKEAAALAPKHTGLQPVRRRA